MTNRGFEVVHTTLDMIQPHQEPIWELPSFGLPPTSTDTERNELSEWVEQVTEPVINELRTETSMVCPVVSCGERVIAYFAMAMSSRVINSWLGLCSPLIDYETVRGAFRAFDDASPFIKFACFTSNRAMLEAFRWHDRVHTS
ncbi:hypothetical protein GOBAR_AA33214 [Gossypium barbadense]|uniref:Uncharacterized protein n=1 Tax=Gossypium barbadense TaxID=3634 RepID=A0A2P5W8U3_GOSBA|nr:hypothetical protein GOBAR_AA33214 [Gossypium barbadense]